MERRAELDWLRGLMLVLMTVTHLPTWYSAHLGQPFGFVSAAEGFVFLSAFLVGSVYGRTAATRGVEAMRRRVWYRAGKLYVAHVALLLFLLLALVPLAASRNATAITDLASFYLAHPRTALTAGLLLSYDPPLLDILPMYVVFLAASPWLIGSVQRRGPVPVLAVSVALWLVAQIGLGQVLHGMLAAFADLPVPYRETGAFSWLAWQLMWTLGLCCGVASLRPRPWRVAPGLVAMAAVVAVAGFVARHVMGQAPADPAWLGPALDKWHLGPLRLLDFAALAVLVTAGAGALRQAAQGSVLTVAGTQSLPVFCLHLVICLAALAVVADPSPALLHWQDSALLAGTLALLGATAFGLQWAERRLPRRAASVQRGGLPAHVVAAQPGRVPPQMVATQPGHLPSRVAARPGRLPRRAMTARPRRIAALLSGPPPARRGR